MDDSRFAASGQFHLLFWQVAVAHAVCMGFISNTLRQHRERVDLLQTDVADRLGFQTTGWISRWENSQTFPNLENLFKLAALYGVLPQDLYPAMWQQALDHIGNYHQGSEKFESSNILARSLPTAASGSQKRKRLR